MRRTYFINVIKPELKNFTCDSWQMSTCISLPNSLPVKNVPINFDPQILKIISFKAITDHRNNNLNHCLDTIFWNTFVDSSLFDSSLLIVNWPSNPIHWPIDSDCCKP